MIIYTIYRIQYTGFKHATQPGLRPLIYQYGSWRDSSQLYKTSGLLYLTTPGKNTQNQSNPHGTELAVRVSIISWLIKDWLSMLIMDKTENNNSTWKHMQGVTECSGMVISIQFWNRTDNMKHFYDRRNLRKTCGVTVKHHTDPAHSIRLMF